MKRISDWLLPLVLAVAGVILIIIGQLDLDADPTPSLAPIPEPTASPVAHATPTPAPSAGATTGVSQAASPTALPTRSPLPDDVVAVQLEVPQVGINVVVQQSTSDEIDDFPTDCCAFVLRTSSQPGRNTNSFMFAHAIAELFKPLWNVRVGAVVRVLMSDATVLTYSVTEVHPNVACPDPDPPNPELNPEAMGVTLPLALQYARDDCEDGVLWASPTDHERLTLQTSQGFNRNWGELVVVAKPIP